MSLADQCSALTETTLAGSSHAQGTTWLRTDQVRSSQQSDGLNVSEGERVVSVAAGSILGLLGVGRRDLTGLLIAGVGAGLIYRGASGRCPMYSSLGIDTAHIDGPSGKQTRPGIHIDESFLINKSPEELYSFWRDYENLPRVMTHLKSVRSTGERQSHWVAEAPKIAGGQIEWDAETISDEPNSRIAWRSVPGSKVETSGSISFLAAPGNRGTKVRVLMSYTPPGGKFGHWVAKLFGDSADQQIRDDLRNFKRTMEMGEIPTVTGQPHGTCMGQGITSGESWLPQLFKR